MLVTFCKWLYYCLLEPPWRLHIGLHQSWYLQTIDAMLPQVFSFVSFKNLIRFGVFFPPPPYFKFAPMPFVVEVQLIGLKAKSKAGQMSSQSSRLMTGWSHMCDSQRGVLFQARIPDCGMCECVCMHVCVRKRESVWFVFFCNKKKARLHGKGSMCASCVLSN